MDNGVLSWMFNEIQSEIDYLQSQLDVTSQKGERSETVGGFASFTYANLPRAAQGGMSNGADYIDVAWCSNGRKAAEGVGAGTGQPVYYDSTVDDWRRFRDDTIVTV